MTLIFHPNIRTMYAYRAINLGFSNPFAITIYSGTQPSADTVAANWANYNSTSEGILWHSQGFGFTTVGENDVTAYLGTIPSAIAPLANGTATWCIAWSTNVAAASLTSATIPNVRFLIADVTNTTGIGTLRLTSTTLSTSTPITVVDFGITVF